MLPEIVLTFHCLNKLFNWSQKFCKFSAFSLEFWKFFNAWNNFFLTIGQNNFVNKIVIPFLWLIILFLFSEIEEATNQKLFLEQCTWNSVLLVQKVENLFWCLNNVDSTSWSKYNSWFLTYIFSDFRSPKWKLHICVGGVKESNFLLERSRIQSRFLTGKKTPHPRHIALAVRYTMSWENWFYCMNQTRNWKLLLLKTVLWGQCLPKVEFGNYFFNILYKLRAWKHF